MASRKPSFIAQLGPKAQEQIRAQIGEKRFNKLYGGRQEGRIRVSPKEDRTCDGIVFASKHEMTTYQALVAVFGREGVELQPVFELQPAFTDVTGKKQQPIKYVADFRVAGLVADAKGMRTDIFKQKRKMFLFIYQQPLWELKTAKDIQAFIEAAKLSLKHVNHNQGNKGHDPKRGQSVAPVTN